MTVDAHGPETTVHGTAVAIGNAGILIRGGAGSGKSALALALIEERGLDSALVADDRVRLWADDDGVFAAPPPELAGVIELRGVGMLRRPNRSAVNIRLVVDLLSAEDCPRLPEAEDRRVDLLGTKVPRLCLPIGVAFAPMRVRIALSEWTGPTTP